MLDILPSPISRDFGTTRNAEIVNVFRRWVSRRWTQISELRVVSKLREIGDSIFSFSN
jgi:hypothetical protein